MAGVEGERPHVERTSQQPRRPEDSQPLQGRAEGAQSLQGPTSFDGHESAAPAHRGRESTSVQLSKVQAAKFNCVVPAITKDAIRRHDSLYVIREGLLNKSLTKRQAEKLEWKWRDRLKKMDRLTIEEKLYHAEEALKGSKQLQKEGALIVHRQALIPVEEEEVAVLREWLRQCKAD